MTLPLVLSAALLGSASAQSYTKTYSLTDAMDKGIAVQSCQNDLTIVEGLTPVRLVAATLPETIQTERDGNSALLMTTGPSGRVPVTIFYEDDTFARLTVTSCKTSGANNLIRLIDNRPQARGAQEFTAQPVNVQPTSAALSVPATAMYNPASATLGFTTPTATLDPAAFVSNSVLTLPAPATVTMSGTLNDAGLILSVRNGSAQTLSLNTQNLRVTSGAQTVSVGAEQKSLAPGQQTSVTIPLSADQRLGALRAVWTVDVPALRAQFALNANVQ